MIYSAALFCFSKEMFHILCEITEGRLVCNHGHKCEETEREILGEVADKKWWGRNLFGWGPQNLKQIWTRATMGRAECKEKEAYGISGLHLTTQTAQGSGLCPSPAAPFHSLPLLAARPQCRCWSCSDRSSLLFAVRMSVVYRTEKWPNGGRLSSVPREIQNKIAKRMELSLSLITPRHSSVLK